MRAQYRASFDSGRDRSRLNALKHGLNLPAEADPEIASHIDQLAHSLAGPLAFVLR